MSYREALTAAIDLYSDPKFVVIDLSPELRVLVKAARERLGQLPPYSPELIERIARVIQPEDAYEISGWIPDAIAVLDALNS